MYKHIKKVERYIDQPIERITQEHSFEYWMLERTLGKGPRKGGHGYGWPCYFNRWCTTIFKIDPRRKIGTKYPEAKFFVGIAKDEQQRAEKNTRLKGQLYPLIDWNITEKECLEFCYNKGFKWDGLYELYTRVSCWCCPLKRKRDYETLKVHFPKYYATMLEWNSRVHRPFKYLENG